MVVCTAQAVTDTWKRPPQERNISLRIMSRYWHLKMSAIGAKHISRDCGDDAEAGTLLYPVSLLSGCWDDQYRNQNANNRDHLVGQLTTQKHKQMKKKTKKEAWSEGIVSLRSASLREMTLKQSRTPACYTGSKDCTATLNILTTQYTMQQHCGRRSYISMIDWRLPLE